MSRINGLTGGPTANLLSCINFPPFSVGEAGRFGFTVAEKWDMVLAESLSFITSS